MAASKGGAFREPADGSRAAGGGVDVMPKPQVLDPRGRGVAGAETTRFCRRCRRGGWR